MKKYQEVLVRLIKLRDYVAQYDNKLATIAIMPHGRPDDTVKMLAFFMSAKPSLPAFDPNTPSFLHILTDDLLPHLVDEMIDHYERLIESQQDVLREVLAMQDSPEPVFDWQTSTTSAENAPPVVNFLINELKALPTATVYVRVKRQSGFENWEVKMDAHTNITIHPKRYPAFSYSRRPSTAERRAEHVFTYSCPIA